MNRVAGAILCGGASSRLGQPKAGCVLHDGKTALWHVANAMRQAGLHPVVAVSGLLGPAQEALLPSVDAVLHDGGADGRHGPLHGVQAALRHLRARTVFWPVDMPAVPPSVLRELALHPAPAVHLPNEPLCAALETSLLSAVDARLVQGHAGVRAVLHEAGSSRIRWGRLFALDPAHRWRGSFNTPAELEVFNALARECAMNGAAP